MNISDSVSRISIGPAATAPKAYIKAAYADSPVEKISPVRQKRPAFQPKTTFPKAQQELSRPEFSYNSMGQGNTTKAALVGSNFDFYA